MISRSCCIEFFDSDPPTRPRLSDSGNEDEMEESICNAV
jgi:hypothetical protein